MRGDNAPKADTLDFNDDVFGVPRDFVAAEETPLDTQENTKYIPSECPR